MKNMKPEKLKLECTCLGSYKIIMKNHHFVNEYVEDCDHFMTKLERKKKKKLCLGLNLG